MGDLVEGGSAPGAAGPAAERDADEGARSVTLQSAVNFRDVGGYRARGGRVRWGRLFRADNISRLTPDDCRVIRQLDVATVLDLRTSNELAEGSFPVAEIPVDFHHVPLLDEIPDPERFKLAPGMLATQYQEIAEDAAREIGHALSLLARPGALPAVVHCTAGKDRTGVLVAMVLSLLGVDERDIVADYALSGAAMDRLRRSLVERYPEGREIIEGADELFSAEPENMARLLEAIGDRYGSAESYAEAAGAGAAVVKRLREELVEPDGG